MGGARITVVGVTAWGLTLAQLAAHCGGHVRLLARDEDEAGIVRRRRTHPARTTEVCLPATVEPTANVDDALAHAGLVILAVPAQAMRPTLDRIAPSLPHGCVLVSAAKGLEIATGLRMTEVLAAACPGHPVVALSGPNLAGEIARGAGINDGLGYGDNAKAAFITRGLAEITRLGVALGANPLTFAGLSGLGDLVATCASTLSRNRRVGEELGRGRKLEDVLATLGHVAEGVPTTEAAYRLARRHGVEMPIVEVTHRVLFDGLPAVEAARVLMGREPRAELRL
jgi:glycerol-3-phosphate dehydrogenase (NAD(P)+)